MSRTIANVTKPLNEHQKRVLGQHSINPNDVHQHQSKLNEEILESYPGLIHPDFKAEDEMPDPTLVTQQEREQELERELRAMQEKEEVRRRLQEAAAREAEASKDSEEESEEEVDPEVARREWVLNSLTKISGGPSRQVIERLKQEYGSDGVMALALRPEEIYLFTYLRRHNFESITQLTQAAMRENPSMDGDKMMKEKVVQMCTIWPKSVTSIEFLKSSRAGTIDALYQGIMQSSHFMGAQQVQMLTVQL